MHITSRFRYSALLLFILLIPAACGLFHPKLPPSTYENLPPETYISFFFNPDTALGPGDYWINNGDTVWVQDTLITGLDTNISVQEVHWWGDDPDGNVIGYYYRWSYMDSAVFTREESAIFYLPLRTQFDIYSLFVSAVDNDSLADPSPAVCSFPVYNSPPSIEWKLNSIPQSYFPEDSVHYSFQHHSFFWDVQDIDGTETVTEVFYALDDTSSWSLLSGSQREIMLSNLDTGTHRIFIKVRDIAGAESNTISFPDPADEESYITRWDVHKAIGDILIVNDYQNDQLLYSHQNLYTGIFDDLAGSNAYSVWEIGGTSTNTANPIPYSPADIEKNLSAFSKVFWFTFRGFNSLNEASLALTRFVADGGILFMNNAQKVATNSRPDTIWTFTDIDTVYQYSATGRVFTGVNVEANWGNETLNNELRLTLSSTLADKLYAIEPGPSSTLRYYFEHDSLNTSDYSGTPPVMIETPIGTGICYYMSIPLYYLNGNDNLDDLFRHVFEIEE
ncbi:MAG: hypothetical protein WC372_06695 [Candidatus Neomarinimicrobiota bacterium]|jgi:hypothetical protein|nr:hypothetical protein [Candidatus Neomarinimicrobiota bacterium]MDD3966554.1 hypothetical protein [Candidatus Neomarinimicrobiota bacterium]MDX9780510.1 hypothetical protein [bacterium]